MTSIISSSPENRAEKPAVESQTHETFLPAEERKLGIALVGLGKYSEQQLGPALTETSYCRLAGVVSGSSEKRERWRHQYNLAEKNLYSYDNFDHLRTNSDIDIVYVVLPNSMHAEYVIKAARAGKHIICEKPMATTVEDCQRMLEACREAGVKLSIGYRLHFDPFNQEMMRLGQKQVYGAVKHIAAEHSMEVGTRYQWRLDAKLAGDGPLMDVGIYCVQGAIYTIGELPLWVNAKFGPTMDERKFDEVEESIEWEMGFPGDIKAVCQSSYSQKADRLRAEAANGWFEIQPAFAYNGLKGRTSDGLMTIESLNQQAAQMDDFALCIQNNSESRVRGEMGLRDVEILLAIYQSARTRKRVELHLDKFKHLVER